MPGLDTDRKKNQGACHPWDQELDEGAVPAAWVGLTGRRAKPTLLPPAKPGLNCVLFGFP